MKPFSIYKKKGSPYFYVKLRNESTGKYLAGRSTKETDKRQAELKVYEWLRKGEINQNKKNINLEILNLENRLLQDDVSNKELEEILSALKRKGKLKGFVLPNTKGDISAYQFMLDFWTWEKSPYIAEKLRKNHGIGKRHCSRNLGYIKNWWFSTLENKVLGELTKEDINKFINSYEMTRKLMKKMQNNKGGMKNMMKNLDMNSLKGMKF